jgi:protein-tyrosine phosphatase
MKAEVYWIAGPWTGRLAIAARPRGGDWLEDEARAWRTEGLDVIVSTLEPEEVQELGLEEEAKWVRAANVEFLEFPIPDRGIPSSLRSTLALVQQLESYLEKGQSVGIHCRQGVGRSALLAACLLVRSGLEAQTAFQRIECARGFTVPETLEQRGWVKRFAEAMAPATKHS